LDKKTFGMSEGMGNRRFFGDILTDPQVQFLGAVHTQSQDFLDIRRPAGTADEHKVPVAACQGKDVIKVSLQR
jgi:hypothetical protein